MAIDCKQKNRITRAVIGLMMAGLVLASLPNMVSGSLELGQVLEATSSAQSDYTYKVYKKIGRHDPGGTVSSVPFANADLLPAKPESEPISGHTTDSIFGLPF